MIGNACFGSRERVHVNAGPCLDVRTSFMEQLLVVLIGPIISTHI